ncbi:MAG: tetratricopeptide repeat protein [Sphingomicrobium sp.]
MKNRLTAALAAGAALTLVPTGAQAQRQAPPSPEQRIDRLEKQLQQVQRQVFPKGRPADTAGYSDDPAATQSSVVNLDQRLDALEKQVADLVRQSEENGNRLRNVETGIGQLKSDQDQRIAALEQRMSDAAAPPVVAPAAVPATTAPVKAKPKPAPSNAPPKKAATAEPAPQEGGPGEAAAAAATDPGEDAYSQGFRLWEAGQYDQAIESLKAFTAAYPKHRRVSYANNLIGRSLLSKGQAREAAATFLANYRGNPGGERAADSLYYLGQAAIQLGQAGQACKVYSEFDAIYGAKARADLRKQVSDAKAQAQCS